MIKLKQVLFEAVKDDAKMAFHTYSCLFVIKFIKKFNVSDMLERIRGIKAVTIVEFRHSDHLDNLTTTSDKYEYRLAEIKFITKNDPKKEVEMINFALVKHDNEKGIDNILGIVASKPKLDSIKKID